MLPDVGMPQGAQVMNALVRASGILATEAGKHFQRKIAEDTVQQQSRAMRNLEPSDDATVAGYRAHSIIGLQNNVLSLSKEVEAEAATFTGTDDEWDEYLGSSFGAMHDNFLLEHPHLEGDVNALSAMNALFGEQLPKLGVARISGKLEQEHLKRQKAFQDNILLRLEGLDGANLTTAANAIMDDGAATLKLTMQEREAMLGQAAINAAKDGDLRLINYTKVFTGNQEASMFERVAGLQDAERAALKLNETRGIAEIAEMKDVNSADLRSGVINAEAFYQNAETIGGYTLAGARSEVARINQIRAEQQRLQLAKEFAGPVTPLDSKTSEGVIQLMQQDMFQAIEDRTKDVTPEQHAAIVQEEKRKMYKQISDKHIHNKQWQDMFDMLPNINPDQLRDAEKLPDNIREAIDLYRALPVGSQRDHDTEKTATLFANYEAFRQQGEGETQAFLAAQRSANNPIPIDAPMRKKAIEAAIEAAEDFSTSAWWSKLLGAPKDLPDWNKARIARQFQVATLANIGAG
ncbi:MAG: hypothetical protein KAT58_13200, partial [candidate division Zixibacteria bacterium]|nr:hypothetical protein [candidate division Zixibacteria bacterium]